MERQFIPYAHQNIDEDDVIAVSKVMRQDFITRGPTVEAFEKAICEKVRAAFAVAFSNGSTALAAAFQAGKVGTTDRIISSPNTFVSSVAHGVEAGATLQLVDIDSYGNMDLDELSKEVSIPRSRGTTVIVPVHFGGVAIDMLCLNESLSSPNVLVIEDAAHALGSFYPDGSPVGSCKHSDMTAFSFHPAKNMTCGEGGIVTTNSEHLYKRLKLLRHNGIDNEEVHNGAKAPWYYEVNELSSNYHMTEMQAALGLSQLRHLDEWGEKKKALVSAYRHKLSSVPGISLLPSEADQRTHYHLFVVRIAFEPLGLTRTQVMEGLAAQGIGSQYHYVPLYNHSALRKHMQPTDNHFPRMNNHFETALSLPLFSSMTEEHIDRVVTALRSVLFQIPGL